MPGAEIHLIGTVHRDPDGFGRLTARLTRFRPDSIALDASWTSVRFRLVHADRLKRLLHGRVEEISRIMGRDVSDHGAIQAVEAMIEMPYEIRAAMESGCPRICFARKPSHSRRYLRELETDLLSMENLRLLAQSPDVSLRDQAARQWRIARKSLDDSSPMDPEITWADEEIACFVQSMDDAKTVVVCGYEHLRGLIRALNPSSAALLDAD
jgi:hypothetical protein